MFSTTDVTVPQLFHFGGGVKAHHHDGHVLIVSFHPSLEQRPGGFLDSWQCRSHLITPPDQWQQSSSSVLKGQRIGLLALK